MAQLAYVPYHPKFDAFITRITLAAMQRVFTQSTGMPLTADIVLQLIKMNDTTLITANGKFIGYYCNAKPDKGTLYMGSVILIPAARRKGYGAEILRHIEQEAVVQGVHTLEGHVQTANQSALRFWLHHGFRVVAAPEAGSIRIRKTLIMPRRT